MFTHPLLWSACCLGPIDLDFRVLEADDLHFFHNKKRFLSWPCPFLAILLVVTRSPHQHADRATTICRKGLLAMLATSALMKVTWPFSGPCLLLTRALRRRYPGSHGDHHEGVRASSAVSHRQVLHVPARGSRDWAMESDKSIVLSRSVR
jgi:hypothetical protein